LHNFHGHPGIGALGIVGDDHLLKHELAATLLPSSTGMTTLATEVWAHTAKVEFAAAAPYAALLILVSGCRCIC